MPMYEKGSVRAEPRSKQQERMKKIMKKFLSSLLALTMILSLVIVPANATNTSKTLEAWSVDMGDETLEKSYTISDTYDSGATYEWSSSAPAVAAIKGVSNAATATVEAKSAGNATITCTVTLPLPQDAGQGAVADTVTYTASVSVTNNQQTFETALKAGKVTFNGRSYDITEESSQLKSTIQYFNALTSPLTAETVTKDSFGISASGAAANTTVKSYADGNLVVKKGDLEATIAITATPVASSSIGTVTVTPSKNKAVQGETITLTPAYTPVAGGPVTYTWYMSDGKGHTDRESTPHADAYSWVLSDTQDIGTWTVTCTAREGSTEVKTGTCTVEVKADSNVAHRNGDDKALYNLVQGETQNLKKPYITDGVNGSTVSTGSEEIKWTSSNENVATVVGTSTGATVTAGQKSGPATITATITYNTKKYKVSYEFVVKALDVELESIANGDYDSYDRDEFARILADKIDDVTSGTSFKYSDVRTVELVSTTTDDYLKFTKDTSSSSSAITDLYQDFRINATKGYLGDQTFKVRVNNKYIVTLSLTVVGAGSTIKDTVNGTAANKDVTFTNSDYKYLYYTTSKVNDNYNDCFDGSRVTGWEKADKNKTVTVKASEFNSNKAVTLNVVGVDSDGVASTGTIEVSQKSYDINYNVVAGKSVTFNQKDFEDFLEDYAEDNGNYNPKKDEITFDHATLNSLPTAKSEGTLYYSGSEVTSSTNKRAEYTDMDKMTFEAVAKPSKDTVTLTFRVYGEIEKPNSRKPDKVDYYVNVVISVVKEDITYTVGIDDTVQLTARDFVNFLQDARTSYRKAELDYVKFDVSGKNVSSYAYGGLYRSYSSYSTGKLADSTDKFYYEPSRTQYDLADVAYHTTRWAEAGKTVYIPFTVYGTKGEEASGTMAITIAQTMNFIDVKPGDFFYEPVKWAVNNKITNGTSSTTFSPYKNCNRAEIVTFLWRAAGSPEPTSTRNPFTDVNSVRDASYYKAILWASQKGITAGTNATTFSPYQECTRSQIVTFLYRYAGKPSGNYTNPFKDVSSVNEASYYNAILWAVGKGITQGTSTTTFSPYASCTRGEAVTFLYRYVNGVK